MGCSPLQRKRITCSRAPLVNATPLPNPPSPSTHPAAAGRPFIPHNQILKIAAASAASPLGRPTLRAQVERFLGAAPAGGSVPDIDAAIEALQERRAQLVGRQLGDDLQLLLLFLEHAR